MISFPSEIHKDTGDVFWNKRLLLHEKSHKNKGSLPMNTHMKCFIIQGLVRSIFLKM